MNEQRGNRKFNWGLLLLVPAAVIVAKGARRRRAMWRSAWGMSEAGGRGPGRHRHFRGDEGAAGERDTFRLPPRVEWMLDTWHTRAHQPSDSREPEAT